MKNLWRTARLSLYGLTGVVTNLGVEVLPADSIWTWVLVVVAILTYIVSRTLVLFDPKTLQNLGARSRKIPLQIGEAAVVTLGIIIAMIFLSGLGFPIGIGSGVIVSVGYLIYHGVALTILESFLAPAPDEALKKERPWIGAVISSSSLVMGELMLLTAVTMTLGAFGNMTSGPWSAYDALFVPLVGLVVVIFGYVPVAQLRISSGDTKEDIFEELLLQTAILYTIAFTGAEPPF